MARHSVLKAAIYKTGMNQKQFADRVGVAEAHLSAIVNGKRPKSLEQAQRIAREVGMTVDELWPLPKEESQSEDMSRALEQTQGRDS